MSAIVLKDSLTGRMTDDQFFRFCMENKGLRIERNEDHEIIIMPPVTSEYSLYNGAVFGQLWNWSKQDNTGVVFESSAGFTLRDGSVLSPDASWLKKETWNNLSSADRNRFAPVCPDFVIEVRSKSDSLEELISKMWKWRKNGVELGWLIDPVEMRSYIFDRDDQYIVVEGFDKTLVGSGAVAGFVLDLSQLS